MVRALDGQIDGPVRTCIGCRQRDEQARLVRLVADAAGRLKIDHLRRQPGRGAWVHRDRRCIDELLTRNALQRALTQALRRKVVLPEGLTADGMLARMERAPADFERERGTSR